MISRKLWENSYFDRYLFGILIAIELLMSFTFLGYIHIPPISVSLQHFYPHIPQTFKTPSV